MSKKVAIRGKEYPQPELGRMKRAQVKKLRPLMEAVTQENHDLDVLWQMIELLFPTLPGKVLDDLEVDECKQVLEDAQIVYFEGAEEVSLGESSASTDS